MPRRFALVPRLFNQASVRATSALCPSLRMFLVARLEALQLLRLKLPCEREQDAGRPGEGENAGDRDHPLEEAQILRQPQAAPDGRVLVQGEVVRGAEIGEAVL